MATVSPVNVPPAEAVEYFRRKGYQISFDWEEVYAEEHARVFTVAKAARLDLLEDIRAAVDEAIAEGTTLRDFRRRLEPTLQKKGWWGRQRVVDPETGEEREVQLGSPRRLEVIYDTNLRSSYAAGRWERIQRTKATRPYLRMVAILDSATRPRHRTWHGTVLPVDHPWWRTHYPPNGWGCRCSTQQLSGRDLERFGYTVADGPPDTGLTRAWTNPRTGEVRQVPIGIDPGFDYNPGIAGLAHARRILAEKLEAAAAGQTEVARAAVRDLVDSEDFARFLTRPDGDYPVMVVPDAVRAAIGAKRHVALLSAESATKNVKRHPDLSISDYRVLPLTGERPQLVIQDGARSVVFVTRGERLVWTVVKATVSGEGLWVTSVRRTNAADVAALRKRRGAKVLIDRTEED